MLRRVHINIGSNRGHRHALIESAVAAISSAFASDGRRSDFFDSEPWGYESEHRFLNLGLMLELDDSGLPASDFAGDVLQRLLAIEREIDPSPHRKPDGSYADRTIDIDLIAIDDIVIKSPSLILPHPRMHLRDFVLHPLAQLAPTWRHPILHLTPLTLLCQINASTSAPKTHKLHKSH